MNTISTRRSIREYSNREVTDALLNRMLGDAERTQTMGNLQLYSVVVTRNIEMKQQLAPAHFNQSMVTEAPVVLTFCADFRRTTLWAESRKATPGYDNFLSFLNATTDTLLFCQTFCNLADEEGLGTVSSAQRYINHKASSTPSTFSACSARSHYNIGMARRKSITHRPPPAQGYSPRRDISRLHTRLHKRILQHQRNTSRKPRVCTYEQ